jgi:hypothetical protein
MVGFPKANMPAPGGGNKPFAGAPREVVRFARRIHLDLPRRKKVITPRCVRISPANFRPVFDGNRLPKADAAIG